ncbi:MAG: hypothetical protein P9X24_08145 [Candidatus Hatepunaea meridiana]|nr:hypothetical protein [Candidatus Hatepunaea meridiana]
MRNKTYIKPVILIIPLVFIFTAVTLTGCDWSCRWDLKRAEKALKAADLANAEFWASPEYQKAQKYHVIAMDLARERRINEARDAAKEAREWAQEATFLSIRRQEEMEKEHDGLNSKKY